MSAFPRFGHHFDAATRLMGWVGASLMLHLALVTLTGGAASKQTHRPFSLDVRLIAPEPSEPLVRKSDTQDIEVKADKTRQEVTVAEHAHPAKASPVTPPESALETPFPVNAYLNSDELDVRAEPANEVLLTYPPAAYVRRQGGIVRITLYISEQGELDRAVLVDATPKGIFEKDALETVAKLQFFPAQRNGIPVKSRKTIEVIFDPHPDPARLRSIAPNSSAAGK